jgi:hypothetical protein
MGWNDGMKEIMGERGLSEEAEENRERRTTGVRKPYRERNSDRRNSLENN